MKRHDIIKAAKIANILLCAMLAGSCSALADELPDSYFETDNVASAVTTASGTETTSVSVSQTQENIVSLETTAEIYKNTVTAAECTFETAVSRANVPETTISETTVPETISEITASETAVITSEETAFTEEIACIADYPDRNNHRSSCFREYHCRSRKHRHILSTEQLLCPEL